MSNLRKACMAALPAFCIAVFSSNTTGAAEAYYLRGIKGGI